MKALIIILIVCAVVAIIMAATKKKENETPIFQETQSKRKVTNKVRPALDHQKRMNKKSYLSKNSENVTILLKEAQEIVRPEDLDLVDQIIDALMSGKETISIERDFYNELRGYANNQ